MGTTFKEMKVGKKNIQLELEDNQPKVVVDGKKFDLLDNLTKHIPELNDPHQALPFSIIANFFFTGINFEVIEDIEGFSKNYKRLLVEDPNISGYGTFDISVIKHPVAEKNQVVFYVEEISTGLPFKVTCPFPYNDHTKPFKYSLLPYV